MVRRDATEAFAAEGASAADAGWTSPFDYDPATGAMQARTDLPFGSWFSCGFGGDQLLIELVDLLDRRDLEKYRVKVVTCEQPTVVLRHAFTTGTIPRTSFEKVLPNTMVQYSKRADGVGCNLPAEDAKAGGKPVQDQHIHEHGTAFNVKGRSLVVISSCGHAGIINTARQAIAVSGVNKLHAALGGFHLFPAPEDYVAKTVAEFKALDPEVIIPMHCSGPTIVAMLRTELADRITWSPPKVVVAD